MLALRRAATVALCSLALATPAHAYVVATSSVGAPLHWETDVRFSLALDPGPAELVDPAADVASAIATWQAAVSPYGITVSLADSPGVVGPHAADGVNTIRWAMDADDPDLEAGLLARTFAIYRTGDGVMIDADIVLDAVDFVWSPDVSSGCMEEYDLDNALTHEIGHALGLAHSVDHPEATMFRTGDACETSKRDLAEDDMAGLAALYAPDVPPDMTEPAPGGSCSVGGTGSGASGLLVLGVLAVAMRARRRTRRPTFAATPSEHAFVVRNAALLAFALALMFASRIVHAAYLRELSVPELAERATLVVRGHAGASRVISGPRIETATTITVDECLSGTCPRSLEVHTLGGEANGIGLRVEGEPTLSRGDEVVLFVRVDARGTARIVGALQGALHVVRTDAAAYVVRDLRGHSVQAPAGWRAGTRDVLDLATLRRALATR